MDNPNTDRIVPLDTLSDFRVANGDPDVRGWEVRGSDDRKIGEVDQLLIDTQAMKVRYLDVDVDDTLLTSGNDRHVLIPIGYARLDTDHDRVIVDQIASGQISTLPEYDHGTLTRDFENSVREPFLGTGRTPATGGKGAVGAVGAAGPAGAVGAVGAVGPAGAAGAAGAAAGDFYAHKAFDEGRFFAGRRNVSGPDKPARDDASRAKSQRDEEHLTLSEEQLSVGRRRELDGEVDIHKRVETEHVRQSVPLSHEEVTVEHRPISRDSMSASPKISEEEVRMPLNREEAVVEKRVVPTEELVVKKRNVTEQQAVEADVRRERVDIEPERGAKVNDTRRDEPGDERG